MALIIVRRGTGRDKIPLDFLDYLKRGANKIANEAKGKIPGQLKTISIRHVSGRTPHFSITITVRHCQEKRTRSKRRRLHTISPNWRQIREAVIFAWQQTLRQAMVRAPYYLTRRRAAIKETHDLLERWWNN